MLKPWQVIAALEANNSRLAKEFIIAEQAATGNTEFFSGARLALDAMITFGVKKVPKSESDGPGLDWVHFDTAVLKLAKREVTGHAALDSIEGLMALATQEQWNRWYRRILIKDLRCGTSETTINKMVTKTHAHYAVPVFSCQLAHDSANHESKVAGKKLIEVKLDGVRVITIVYPDGRVDQYSRNGKELVNFPHVVEQIAKVAHGFNEPMVLDGEIMSGSFQDLMKQIHRKSNAPAADAVLNLFDYVTLAEFETGASTVKQEHRSRMLVEWFATVQAQLPNVTVVGQELVDLDTDAGQARYREINLQAIAGGYEGIMLKDPDAAYECKRSVAWLKLKPFIEVSLTVRALEEGTGRNVGRLGALVCAGSDDGKTITVNVGSGFSDLDRDQFWHAHVSGNSIIDQIVEIRADAITQNQDGTYSLRFPRFLHFRGFVSGEKI
jgi:DNA ligase-1